MTEDKVQWQGLVNTVKNFRVLKRQGISSPAERISASQEGT
jgi:hypothetical protein